MNFLIILCAKYLLFISALITGIFFLCSDKIIKKKLVWPGITSSLISFLLAKISAHFIYDARPFVVSNIQPLIQHAADNGFPSDHTLVASLASFIVLIFNKKTGLILMLCTILIGVARVLSGIHHPLDVIGSIVIALVSVILAQYILKTNYFHSLPPKVKVTTELEFFTL